jgi:hypothetical protein
LLRSDARKGMQAKRLAKWEAEALREAASRGREAVTKADQETVRRMRAEDGPRRANWIQVGLVLLRGERAVARIYRPPWGPDLPERSPDGFRDTCRAWIARGELPASADWIAHEERTQPS